VSVATTTANARSMDGVTGSKRAVGLLLTAAAPEGFLEKLATGFPRLATVVLPQSLISFLCKRLGSYAFSTGDKLNKSNERCFLCEIVIIAIDLHLAQTRNKNVAFAQD